MNDKRVDPESGERCRFSSSIVPPRCRKNPKLVEMLRLLYLHGLSTGDFVKALTEFRGSASGLSTSAISRLTAAWQGEYCDFSKRSLAGTDYVYVLLDGISFNVRLEERRLCPLVMIGMPADPTKELFAVYDGCQESTE